MFNLKGIIRIWMVAGVLWKSIFATDEISAQTFIEGTYDRQYKKFIPHVNLLGQGLNPMYKVETLVHGYGVIENKANLRGVIDSTGKVLVALEYESLEACRSQRGYFVFHRSGKTGLVSINGIEQCTIKCSGKHDDMNRIVETRVKEMFYLFVENKVGLFDSFRNRIIIPPIYENRHFLHEDIEKSRRGHAYMYLNDTLAFVRNADSLFVHDVREPGRSQPYRDVVLLSNGLLFLKSFNDFVAVCGDFMNPVNGVDFRVLDTYNDYLLGRNTVGYGVTTASGKVVIPFIYEDVYFVSKDALWLKKDGKWALANYRHELLSTFEFEDIEKSNDWFIHQLLDVTRLDTTGGNLFIKRDYPGINDVPTDLKIMIFMTEGLQGSKRLYNTLLDRRGANRSVAKKADGWHFLYPPLGTIEPEAWEDVRYVPNWIDPYGLQAYKLKGKWGVGKEEIRYENIMYDALELTLNCTNECIVKHGYIYSYTTNYNGGSKENCVYEKQMKYEEYTVR